MNILDATICHILTQLTYRYIPLPRNIMVTAADALADFKLDEVEVYLRYHRNNPKKAWSAVLREKLDGCISLVLTELASIFNASGARYGYLSICDERYPVYLRATNRPPYGLFFCGNLDVLERPCIAIIGARKAAETALDLAFHLAQRLGIEGASIASGGAIGCDAAAHLGALSLAVCPAPTIGVMAGGIDKLYPRTNRQMFADFAAKDGLILSERLLGTQPKPYDFPIRNRIIAGLAQRVILIQAALKSGAMNTVSIALQEGRDVMVYRGDQGDIRFAGNESLIADGAAFFHNLEDYFDLKWHKLSLELV